MSKFQIIILPKATYIQLNIIYFFCTIIIGGTCLGILINNILISLGCFLGGLLGIGIFNAFTKMSFSEATAFRQKNGFIDFSEKEIIIKKNDNLESIKWTEIKDISIKIMSFKGKIIDSYDSDSFRRYTGYEENKIIFKLNEIQREINFQIAYETDYLELQDLFINKILPNLYKSKTVKNEFFIISKLNYSKLQKFKKIYNINRYTDNIYFN